jgi:hypothetical protein
MLGWNSEMMPMRAGPSCVDVGNNAVACAAAEAEKKATCAGK